MANENIGELGRTFIAQRLEVGIEFDNAWAQWALLSSVLTFVINECPEVRYYDDRRVADRDERQRIRQLAQEKIGPHVRSSDVSLLGRAAGALGLMKPVRPYHIDREFVRHAIEVVADATEANSGFTDRVAAIRAAAANEDDVESHAKELERFAERHSLWDIPPESILRLYLQAEPNER